MFPAFEDATLPAFSAIWAKSIRVHRSGQWHPRDLVTSLPAPSDQSPKRPASSLLVHTDFTFTFRSFFSTRMVHFGCVRTILLASTKLRSFQTSPTQTRIGRCTQSIDQHIIDSDDFCLLLSYRLDLHSSNSLDHNPVERHASGKVPQTGPDTT